MTTMLMRYQDEPTVLKFVETTVDLSSGIYFTPPVMSYTMHECLEYKSNQFKSAHYLLWLL